MKRISRPSSASTRDRASRPDRGIFANQYLSPDELDHRWGEFVNCQRRIATMGPFLLRQLPEGGDGVAIDAAMGIGCEVQFLLKHCSRVVGNEINAELLHAAIRNLSELLGQSEPRFELCGTLWQHLAEHFRHKEFDLGLLLGNSFCLVPRNEDRRVIAEACRSIIKNGGAFIVDERNFSYLLSERKTILSRGFRYTGKVVFCGATITGCPIRIDETEIVFRYEDVQTGKILGYRRMFPFAPGEIKSLFCSAGFQSVETFSDLKPGFDKRADFYTYVFR